MQSFADLLLSIPEGFWGVLAGSGFTLFGVIITNKSNYKRTLSQFTHERDIRRMEREYQMMEKIYLAAIEAISDRFSVIMRMSNTDIPDSDVVNDEKGGGAAIVKAQLISDEPLRSSISALETEFGKACLRLYMERFPINLLNSDVKILSAQMDEFSGQYKRTLELMNEYNLSGKVDARYWQRLDNNFKHQMGQFEVASKKRDEVFKALLSRRLGLLEKCNDEFSAVTELAIPVEIQIRQKLQVSTDEVMLEKMARDAIAQRRAVMVEFVGRVRQQFQKEFDAWKAES